MIPALKPRHAIPGILLVASVTIAAAWAFQVMGGYAPCPLCLQQRWPYYAIIPIAIILLWMSGRERLVRAGLLLIALIMFAGAVLAVYHAGIEWQWWQGPQACSGGAGLTGTLPDLSNLSVVRCDEAALRILGLSLAGWNALTSLLIAGLALAAARRRSA
ncbi:MAG TPA: disulfide bond formation protein B [Aestuariivirgaceae bacterium]|jgi:disulfide bond formation protein DsbB|nr:disulfide bond formation protein B [Aestuariivirgaceae bacterium]